MPNGDVADKSVYSANDIDRTNFRQMIEAAVSNAQQHNAGYTAKDNRRQRFGSGRIPDNCGMKEMRMQPIGIDVRYMNNELFRDLKDTRGNRGRRDDNMPFNWNQVKGYETASSENDNTDAKSDEPEWAHCGPISKNDIIELHGFDGPIDDDKHSENSSTDVKSDALLARSTPSKSKASHSGKLDEYFNFEEFLKLDMPQTVSGGARDNDAGESRFQQWFGRPNSPNRSKSTGIGFYDTKGKPHNAPAGQHLNWQQRANLKKMQSYSNLANASKFRSVEELEANMCPNQPPKAGPSKTAHADPNNFQNMLNRSAAQSMQQKNAANAFNPAQVNFLLNLINRNAEELYQQRLSKSAALQRPDAQLLIHRLVNSEITQFHILQQMSSPTIHQRDRETLVAVLK